MSMAPDAETRPVGRPDPMTPAVARVLARRQDGPDVFTLDIEVPPGGTDPHFAPGQFDMMTVFGVGEVPISFSGDPGDTGRLVHTIRAVGPVSAALTRLEPGDAVGLRGPFGVGWPMEEAAGRDVVVIAGGLGLAPLRPALYRLMAERERYGSFVVLYGTRSPGDILFRDEIEAWRRRLDVQIEVTVDHAMSDWRGHVGVVTTLLPRADFDPSSTTAFVCGPEVMMRFGASALADAGVDETSIWLSMERNMKCAVGFCGHCQFGPTFICRDGPVFRYDRLKPLLGIREL